MRISDPMGYDDDPDYDDARCLECGAGPDELCTADCACDRCQHVTRTEDEHAEHQ